MRHVLLAAAAIGGFLAFTMAYASACQMLGISGRLDGKNFVLGPSWGWFWFDVAGFILDLVLAGGCVYIWTVMRNDPAWPDTLNWPAHYNQKPGRLVVYNAADVSLPGTVPCY